MLRRMVLLVGLVIVGLPAQAAPGSTGRSGAIELVKVSDLQRAWQKAYAEGDESTLRRLVSDSFVVTNTTGHVLDRTNAVSHYGMEREKVDLAWEDQQVVLYGTAAVATAKVRETYAGGRQILLRATDTFIQQRGVWRVAASHWTRLPPEIVKAGISEVERDRFVGEYRGPQGGLLKVARSGDGFLVTGPRAAPIEFVAISDTTLVDPASNVRWLFIGKTGTAFEYVVVQGPNGLIKLQRTP